MSNPGRRALLRLAPLAVLPLLLAACSSGTGASSSGASTPDGDRLSVLASFYPLQFVAQQVGGDRVSVDSLTPPGAEPHDVELSPAQVARVGRADLVVYLSGFQAAVDDAVEQTSPARVLDAADVEQLMTVEQEGSTESVDDGHSDDEHSDEAHSDEAHDDEHEHADGLDPHFWLDPSRMPALVEAVAHELSDADPDGAATFAANAEALSARFTDLDAAYKAGLATCETRTFVTSHEAFGYLALRYDLHQVGISGLDPEAEPSPARLAAVQRVVREKGVTTIFFESLVSPKVAQTLARDLGIDSAVLDPIEGVRGDDADYFTIAEANLEALRVALSCS